ADVLNGRNASSKTAPLEESAEAVAEKPVFDLETITEFRADAGEKALHLLVNTFITDTVQKLDQLSALVDMKGSAEAVRLVHSLKGGGAMAGALALAKLAAEVERQLNEDKAALTATQMDTIRELFEAYRNGAAEHGLVAAA